MSNLNPSAFQLGDHVKCYLGNTLFTTGTVVGGLEHPNDWISVRHDKGSDGPFSWHKDCLKKIRISPTDCVRNLLLLPDGTLVDSVEYTDKVMDLEFEQLHCRKSNESNLGVPPNNQKQPE